MELILLLTALVAAVGNLILCIYVTVQMAKDYSVLWALLGFFCCQIAVFIWGWGYWRSEHKTLVMGIWTVLILISMAFQLIVGVQSGAASSGGY